MFGRRRHISYSLPIVLTMTLVFASAVPVSAAGSNSGTTNCLAGKSIKVWTRSSIEVWHHWTSGWFSYWANVPGNGLRESLTGYQSSWWSSSWSTTTAGSGATCISVG